MDKDYKLNWLRQIYFINNIFFQIYNPPAPVTQRIDNSITAQLQLKENMPLYIYM